MKPEAELQIIDEETKKRREKVQAIRASLEPFDYELHKPEELDGVSLERVAKKVANDAEYDGQCIRGEGTRHGRGVQTEADGSIYEGYWRLDKADGYGRMIYGNGNVYIGMWKNDLIHGQGKDSVPNKYTYEGLFSEGKRHG